MRESVEVLDPNKTERSARDKDAESHFNLPVASNFSGGNPIRIIKSSVKTNSFNTDIADEELITVII